MGQTPTEGPYGAGQAVIGFAGDYRDGDVLAPHCHDRAQLLYGLTGIVMVATDDGAWMMPPECGLWIPPRTVHEVRMIGPVRARSLYLLPDAVAGMPDHCEVLAITPLMRSLLNEAVRLSEAHEPTGRDGALVALLLHEIASLSPMQLSLPLPADPRLKAMCQDFLQEPTLSASIDRCCARLRMSRRSFTRHFRIQTGLSFVDWRQRACVLAAIPRLAAGEPVTDVAMDLGYANPAAFSTMVKRATGQTPSYYGKYA